MVAGKAGCFGCLQFSRFAGCGKKHTARPWRGPRATTDSAVCRPGGPERFLAGPSVGPCGDHHLIGGVRRWAHHSLEPGLFHRVRLLFYNNNNNKTSGYSARFLLLFWSRCLKTSWSCDNDTCSCGTTAARSHTYHVHVSPQPATRICVETDGNCSLIRGSN